MPTETSCQQGGKQDGLDKLLAHSPSVTSDLIGMRAENTLTPSESNDSQPWRRTNAGVFMRLPLQTQE